MRKKYEVRISGLNNPHPITQSNDKRDMKSEYVECIQDVHAKIDPLYILFSKGEIYQISSGYITCNYGEQRNFTDNEKFNKFFKHIEQ